MDVAIHLKAGLTEQWAVVGEENKALKKRIKEDFRLVLRPGGGRLGIAWEYPDASVSSTFLSYLGKGSVNYRL